MSLDTYANLKTAIADTLDRDDLTANIPDFITLAEARHKRSTDMGGIRSKEMINRSAVTVNARQVALPTGYLEAINFRLLTDPVTILTYVNYHELNRIRVETTGKPEYFTIGNEFEFNKAPDSSYSGEIVYYKSETALSDSNTSNNILAADPAAYLYGALVASAPFITDDPRIALWKGLYDEAARGLNGIAKGGRVIGPIRSRVSGSTP